MTSFAGFSFAETDWLASLPEHQRKLVEELLLAQGTPEGAAQAWLDLSTFEQTAPFGARGGGRLYFEKFLDRLHDRLCSDANREERQELSRSAGFEPATVVAGLTASIAPLLSAAPSFVAPAVALMLTAIGKTGLQAWCDVQTERRKGGGGHQ